MSGAENDSLASSAKTNAAAEAAVQNEAQRAGEGSWQDEITRMLARNLAPEEIAQFMKAHPASQAAIINFLQRNKGNSYVQQVRAAGEKLGEKDKDGFTLEPVVRANLLRDVEGRTNRAYTAYLAAITELEIAEMIKKDEEIGIFTEIIVGAIFGAVGAGLVGALKSLKSVKKVQESLKLLGSKVASEALKSGIDEVSEKSLEITVGSVLDVGKDHTKDGIKKMGAEGGEQPGDVRAAKTSAMSYLDSLKISGAKLFQEMAESVPQTLNDSELLAYWSALDADYQNAPAYHEKIEHGLKRYMSTDAHNIGRTRVATSTDSLGYDPVNAIRETRVAWVAHDRTGSKQLIYVHRDFDETQVFGAQTSTFANHSNVNKAWEGADGNGALSYGDEYVKDNKSIEVPSINKDGDVFAGFVEPDMVDIAIRQHEATWRYKPRTYPYTFIARALQPDILHQGG